MSSPSSEPGPEASLEDRFSVLRAQGGFGLDYAPFGFGCFNFGADPEKPIDLESYVDQISAVVPQLEGVSNFSLTHPKALNWFRAGALPLGLEDGGQPYPAVAGLQIEFTLEMSPGQQESINPWTALEHDLAPVTFDVCLRQGLRVPIAVVVPREERSTFWSPVSYVWHSLRDGLQSSESGIRLDVRGPSPIHVECLVARLPTREPAPRSRIEYERVVTPSGVAYLFGVDEDVYATAKEAAFAVGRQAEPIVDFFYEINGAQARQLLQWGKLDAIRSEVIGLETRRGPKASVRRRGGRALRDLAVGLSEYETEEYQLASRFSARRSGLEERMPWPFLLREIDGELATGLGPNVEQLHRVTSMFETRRLASAQNFAVVTSTLAAGLVGAILGSALTLALSGNDSSPAQPVTEPGQPSTVTVTTTEAETTPTTTTAKAPTGPKTPSSKTPAVTP